MAVKIWNLLNYLLIRELGVNEVTNEGLTVLMMASVYGNIDIIKLLINKGADINAKNNDSDTAHGKHMYV